MVTNELTSTRDKLLAAAVKVFVEHGFAGARVDAVAAAAGVNKRMLYHHFGDKQGLYAAVLDHAANLAEPDYRLQAWEGLQPLPPSDPDRSEQHNDSSPELDQRMYDLLLAAFAAYPVICAPAASRLVGVPVASEEFAAAWQRLHQRLENQHKAAKTKMVLRPKSRPHQ